MSRPKKDVFDENSTYTTAERATWDYCRYEDLVISDMLNRTERALDIADPFRQRPEISFDPEFGYVTYFSIHYHRNGIFTQVNISDCCSSYKFSDYEPTE